MIQGTASGVGKTVLVAALCRIFRRWGMAVAPFKAQNMALHAAVTPEGGEVARSTVLQARAAGVAPSVWMNPVLLKPQSDGEAQMVLLGRPWGTTGAWETFGEGEPIRRFKWEAIVCAWRQLAAQYEGVVIEGAGSPAEVNLQAWDVVNMAVARLTGAPVLLVADIDRGGALAALVGTLALLSPEDRRRVQGLVLNRFRGDLRVLQPALAFLETRTGCPVVGVIPWFPDLDLEEEDTLRAPVRGDPEGPVDVAVVALPRMANEEEFDPLALEPGVRLRFVRRPEDLGDPDLLILPGSKNVFADREALHRRGWDRRIHRWVQQARPLMGICGGFQLLGRVLRDPEGVEGGYRGGEAPGLGILPLETVYRREKQTRWVMGAVQGPGGFPGLPRGMRVPGYEIHCGRSRRHARTPGLFRLRPLEGGPCLGEDGGVHPYRPVWGTHLHGLLEDDRFRRHLVNTLRHRRGLPPLAGPLIRFRAHREAVLDRWADHVARHLDLDRIRQWMERGGGE